MRVLRGFAIVPPMVALVLASTSPYRRQLLERLGVPFTCVAPGVDEAAAASGETSPIAIARSLAAKKAAAVAKDHGKDVVIGADQVVALGDRVLGKPGSAAKCKEQLQALQGQEHMLITAVAVQKGKDVHEFVEVTTLRMRALTSKEIDRYVERDQPLDCAGSYKFERAGVALFDRVQGEDHTAILGLPMVKLCAVLRECGIDLP